MNESNNDLNGFYRILIYAAPLVILILSCLNFLISTSESLNFGETIAFLGIHIIFLVALSTAFGNFIIEAVLSIFNDSKASNLEKSLYNDKKFIPVRTYIFIGIFIAGYVFLTQYFSFRGAIVELILLLPPVAIAINSRRLLSERIRFINGSYMFYNGKFNIIISFYTDIRGQLTFVTDEGKLKDTGVTADDTDLQALAEELKKNGLKSGTKI